MFTDFHTKYYAHALTRRSAADDPESEPVVSGRKDVDMRAALIEHFREIASIMIVRQEAELGRALEQFRAAAEITRTRIHQHITKVLGDLEDDVRAIYAVLRKNDDDVPVTSVRVEEKSMPVVLDLFGEKEMVPSSYLSDSQLNSLGLALYFARGATLFPMEAESEGHQ